MSTNLHAGREGSVDLCYDVDDLSHPGVDRHTLYYQHGAVIAVSTHSGPLCCETRCLDGDTPTGSAAFKLIRYPMVCSKWMSSTEAVIQEQPACLSAGRREINS